MEEQEIQKFVWYELNGYGDTDESRKMMDRVWRWTDKTKDEGWWHL